MWTISLLNSLSTYSITSFILLISFSKGLMFIANIIVSTGVHNPIVLVYPTMNNSPLVLSHY
jgi:hypothetical protein